MSLAHEARSDTRLVPRLVHAAQIAARSFTQRLPLREVLVSSDALVGEVTASLKASPAVQMLGVEVLSLSILSIKPGQFDTSVENHGLLAKRKDFCLEFQSRLDRKNRKIVE